MSFDSKTNKITIREKSDLPADSGSFFLKVLRDVAARPGVPESRTRDWKVVESWLGCAGRDLTPHDYDRFGQVFRSYLARGIAPSAKLDPSFQQFAAMAKTERWPTVSVPRELEPVFERMLASDPEILHKKAERALEFAAVLNSLSASPKPTSTVQRRNTQRPSPSAVDVNWIPVAVSTAMLLIAAFGDWHYGFYQLLRIVVCGTAAYVVAQTMNRYQYWPWIAVGIAILFNPILPIEFKQEEWRPINFGAAIVFVFALVQLRRRSS